MPLNAYLIPNEVEDSAEYPRPLKLGLHLYTTRDVEIYALRVSNAKNQTNEYVTAKLVNPLAKNRYEFKLYVGKDFPKYENYEVNKLFINKLIELEYIIKMPR